MKTLSLPLATGERRCAVDAAEFDAWGRALLDELLLAAAVVAGERGASDPTPVEVTLRFSVTVDAAGALVIGR